MFFSFVLFEWTPSQKKESGYPIRDFLQLKRLLDGLAKFHIHSQEIVSQEKLFPIEVDWAPPELEHQGAEETGFD